MDIALRDRFIALWEKYFGSEELPIAFFFGDDPAAAPARAPGGHSCIVCELARVRKGESVKYAAEAVACGGAKRYLGFSGQIMPGFEYFLSCGNDRIEGERYKRTPEIVRETQRIMRRVPVGDGPIVFKRWDRLAAADEPLAVVFFAKPDVLSGLFTLANFDRVEPEAVTAPFAAGCGSIVHYPYLEQMSERPRAVLGMFDPSARPCVPAGVLTIAFPMKRFTEVVGFMEESFLVTGTWKKVRARIMK
ncbi:MAG: DUF169 domain-containing protein [Spirochaetes bacterium]|nr:DUF169 domain-containing protein [Spirochaetota bacterium]